MTGRKNTSGQQWPHSPVLPPGVGKHSSLQESGCYVNNHCGNVHRNLCTFKQRRMATNSHLSVWGNTGNSEKSTNLIHCFSLISEDYYLSQSVPTPTNNQFKLLCGFFFWGGGHTYLLCESMVPTVFEKP